jgi:hypothetical protein
MLRLPRPIAIRWHSVVSTFISSLPTRWGSLASTRRQATRSVSWTMATEKSPSNIKGTEHNEPPMSGRHPTDEDYKSFIDRLGRLPGFSLDGKPRCISCDRLTEKSNRVFLLTMDDGRQLVAKIQNPVSGLAGYTTESEVATMKFRTSYLITCLTIQG